MSFSGLKTAVINLVHKAEQTGSPLSRPDVAASFQQAVCDILSDKAVRAAKSKLALAGGVSANGALRAMLAQKCRKKGLPFYCPDLKYCTDNAAMIGSAGYYLLMAGQRSDLDLNAIPYLDITANTREA